MKTIILLGDGMADTPVPELQGRTPLMAAKKEAMDWIALHGRTGLFRTIEPGMPTGSAIANLSVLGYAAADIFHGGEGRSVLEAASLSIPLEPSDLALRVNLISVEEGRIKSHSAGHISTEEAHQLIEDLHSHFLGKGVSLHAGLSYRHLLIVPNGDETIECAPPHDHLGEEFRTLLVRSLKPEAESTARFLNDLILESQLFLKNHPVNRKRLESGKQPANSLWPWSPGKKPRMKTLREQFGISSAVISAVDLIKGLGVYAGMDVIEVEGATGLYDTNYEGKADAALRALEDHDLVYVHVEAPDEAGHEKNPQLKIRCIEEMDRRLVRRILDGLGKAVSQTVVAVLPDHPTPVAHGAHTRDPVPVAVLDPRKKPDGVDRLDEESVKKGCLGLLRGDEFIKIVLDF